MSIAEFLSKPLGVGSVTVPGGAWFAPMTGVSDLPFRLLASRLGAPYVATEMVACEQLAAGRADMVRRAAIGEGLPLMVVQLVGADPTLLVSGARTAAAAGAHVIDLNFGCPAKSVTGIACGSALMRRPELAIEITARVAEAVSVPVTAKIRLGWDDGSRNAPEFAAALVEAGARAITVHGRTRMQFYKGQADWAAVRAVKAAVSVPVLVNGDVVDPATGSEALAASGADGLMIGRGAIGRPWLASTLGGRAGEPGPAERLALVLEHRAASLAFYGERLGDRMFRKHLAAYVDAAPWPADDALRRARRAELCALQSQADVARALSRLWLGGDTERLAA